MKRGIIIIVTLIVLSLVVFFAFNYVKSKNLISKEKVINNIVFKKAKITKKAGKYNFSVTIKCKGKENAVIESFDAIILDKKGNKIDVTHITIPPCRSNSRSIFASILLKKIMQNNIINAEKKED